MAKKKSCFESIELANKTPMAVRVHLTVEANECLVSLEGKVINNQRLSWLNFKSWFNLTFYKLLNLQIDEI